MTDQEKQALRAMISRGVEDVLKDHFKTFVAEYTHQDKAGAIERFKGGLAIIKEASLAANDAIGDLK